MKNTCFSVKAIKAGKLHALRFPGLDSIIFKTDAVFPVQVSLLSARLWKVTSNNEFLSLQITLEVWLHEIFFRHMRRGSLVWSLNCSTKSGSMDSGLTSATDMLCRIQAILTFSKCLHELRD